jgi:hypothetical protein
MTRVPRLQRGARSIACRNGNHVRHDPAVISPDLGTDEGVIERSDGVRLRAPSRRSSPNGSRLDLSAVVGLPLS